MVSRDTPAPALRPVRVMLEIPSLDGGGMERMAADLALGLRDAGLVPVVVCTERGGREADRLRAAGIPVEILTHGDRRAELAALLDHHEIDLLNAHYSSLGIPLAAERDLPVVVTLHNVYAWVGAGVLDEIRHLDRSVSLYVAVSESVARFTSERFGIDRGRIVTIRNGVAAPADQAPAGALRDAERAVLRTRLGIAADAELVVQVGRIERVKCQLALVDAVAALQASRPRLRAWIVGSPGEEDYAERVRRRVAELGLEGRISLVGQRADVPEILAAADVFAQASVIEGLSLALVEALRAGLPVVATRVGDADWLLGAGEAGFAASPPGVIVDGPRVDPHASNWMTLREMAGAESPPHGGALARAIASVLDDLPRHRAGAVRRAAELGGDLDLGTMVARSARVYVAVVAARAAERGRELRRVRAERETYREDERAWREQLARLTHRIEAMERLAEETGRRIAQGVAPVVQAIAGDVAATRNLTGQIHQIATRTLDKLRLGHRLRSTLGGWGHRGTAHTAVAGTEQVGANDGRDSTNRDAALGWDLGAAGVSISANGVPVLPVDPRPARLLVLGPGPVLDGEAPESDLARWGSSIGDAAVREGVAVASACPGRGVSSPGVELVGWPRDEFERWLLGRDERLRVLALGDGADVAERLDLCRQVGARVILAGNSRIVGSPRGRAHDAIFEIEPEQAGTVVARGETVTVVPPEAARAGARAVLDALYRPSVSIIVLCFNNRDVIEPCVESLLLCRGELDYEVIVVDNGSTDGSREWLRLRARGGELTILENDRNGCSSGRNLGIRASSGEIVVFLDSDQKALRSGWLDPALDILRNHRMVGAVSWNAGWFHPGTGGGTIVDDLPARGMSGSHSGALFRADVAFLATSGMAVPRAVLARTTLFDDFYDPTCFEDTDLSFQIKQAGYEIVYCPYLAIDHRPHSTTGALGDYSDLYRRNERYFLDKWKHRPEWFFDVR